MRAMEIRTLFAGVNYDVRASNEFSACAYCFCLIGGKELSMSSEKIEEGQKVRR